MKVEIKDMLTIKNYAKKWDVTTSYIYKLVNQGDLTTVVIDGVQFIDISKFPNSPKKR